MTVKSMTLDLKKIKPFTHETAESIAKNWRLILLAMIFCCGLVVGTMLCFRSGNTVNLFVKSFADKLFSQKSSRIFLILSGENIILSTVVFISGMCAVGLPAILLCPCAQGILIGTISSYMYTSFDIDGVIFTAIIIVPFCAVTVLMLLIACNEAAIMSSAIVKALLEYGENNRGEVKEYLLRGIIILLVMCVVSLIQAICLAGFGEKLLI